MIQTVTGSAEVCRGFIEKLKERIGENDRKVDGIVSEIIETVRKNGDAAVRAYTEKFDGAAPEKTEISKEELKELAAQCDPQFLSALEKAAANIRDFHQRQKQQSWLTTKENGVMMGQRCARPAPGGHLCSRRHSGLSLLRTDECNPRQNCRGRGDHHGDAPRQKRQAQPGHYGSRAGSRC